MKNDYVTRKNIKKISYKVIYHYYSEKGHIRPKCHLINVKFPNGLMTWIPKGPNTHPKDPTQVEYLNYLVDMHAGMSYSCK